MIIRMSAALRRTVAAIAVFAAMLAGTVSAAASPWVEVGDVRLREDIEALADAGLIRGTITNWPLPWAQIADLSDGWEVERMPVHLQIRAKRVLLALERAGRKSTYEARMSFTNEPALVRRFEETARTDAADVAVSASHMFGSTYINYGVGWRPGQRGTDYHFDDVYVAQKLGNWIGYAGTLPTWWGPGQEGALLFSNSARPMPKIGIKRLIPKASTWPVLRWFGPWTFDLFVGRLEGSRDFAHPLVVGNRISIQPHPQFELSVSRVNQLCGSGRPCGLDTFWKALRPIRTRDNEGTFEEPGNQIASIDARWGGMVAEKNVALYGQIIGEDGDGPIEVDVISWLAGGTVSGGLANGATWKIGAEGTDTLAVRLFSEANNTVFPNGRNPGVTYNHFIYTDGYTYFGKPIGFSLDGDARMFSLTGNYTDVDERRFAFALRRTDINISDDNRYRISQSRERIWIGEAGVDVPTRFGDIGVELRYQTDRPNTPGTSPDQLQAELSWTSRF